MAPDTQMVVLVIGALRPRSSPRRSALTQNDIKKVLAYSTVSQLGFMFIGMGVGAYAAGVFHLMTHAFFKACLFLGSGSVIHAMHHEQDMRKMGGLKRWMPITYWTFLISTLAIAGIFAAVGLHFEGLDPLGGLRQPPPFLVGDRSGRRVHDRLLHVPARLHDLPRRVPGRSSHAGTPARVTAIDDHAAGRARRLGGRGGPAQLAAGFAAALPARRRIRDLAAPGGRQGHRRHPRRAAARGAPPRSDRVRHHGDLAYRRDQRHPAGAARCIRPSAPRPIASPSSAAA